MKRILAAPLFVLLLAAAVHAATLTGKWEGTTPSGTPIVLDLNATETVLTGTLTRSGQTAKITDGKVSKNTFTFTVTINDQTQGFSGELAGEELKVWPDSRGPDGAAVFKRVKT